MELKRHQGPPPETDPIPVEFVVLHYTAETLEETLRLFRSSDAPAGAHLVVDEDGSVHEVTPCWEGTTWLAPHAGRSRWEAGGVVWEKFNECSIGIEIVNLNGNCFAYTEAQYGSLRQILLHLRNHYPALNDPARILGHEQIAGWRGKADPGAKFDWHRLYQSVYPGAKAPVREPAASPEVLRRLESLAAADPADPEERILFWRSVSWFLERAVGAPS